jgi:hypothetical protein
MRRVVLFLQTKTRGLISKRVVEKRRELWCENSHERRHPLLEQISQQILLPYQWLRPMSESSFVQDERATETLKETLSRNFFQS